MAVPLQRFGIVQGSAAQEIRFGTDQEHRREQGQQFRVHFPQPFPPDKLYQRRQGKGRRQQQDLRPNHLGDGVPLQMDPHGVRRRLVEVGEANRRPFRAYG